MSIAISAFSTKGNWYKGNLHTHTLLSDGKSSAEQITALYQNAGYHFLAITDHNAFRSYPHLSGSGLLLLSGTELTPGFDKSDAELMAAMEAHQKGTFVFSKAAPTLRQKLSILSGPHVVAISRKQTDAAWDAEHHRLAGLQPMIDYAAEKGCLSIIAHPVWSRLNMEELSSLHGFASIEVYNHASHPWAEASVHWDTVLNHGMRAFASACDDTHDAEEALGGYIMLKAPALTYDAVMEAFENGEYYSSSGPAILDFHHDNGYMAVSCSPAREIRFLTDNIFGRTYRAKNEEDLTHCAHKLFGNERYVRVEVVDAQGRKAWTNPVFLD